MLDIKKRLVLTQNMLFAARTLLTLHVTTVKDGTNEFEGTWVP
jgi:hypothetical protein